MHAARRLTSPAVPLPSPIKTAFLLLLALAAPTGARAQQVASPPIIRRPPPPIDTVEMTGWRVRELRPADSTAIYKTVLAAGLNAILAIADQRARPVYLDAYYPPESAAILSPWIASGAIGRVCLGMQAEGCRSMIAHSIELGPLQVIHRDTVLVRYMIDGRRREEYPMELFRPEWLRSREWEVGIFTPLSLPRGPCWVEMLDDYRGTNLLVARSHDGWTVIGIDPGRRPHDGGQC